MAMGYLDKMGLKDWAYHLPENYPADKNNA